MTGFGGVAEARASIEATNGKGTSVGWGGGQRRGGSIRTKANIKGGATDGMLLEKEGG